jgi:hypothetical protein
MTTTKMIVLALQRRIVVVDDYDVVVAVLDHFLQACTQQWLQLPIFGKVVIWYFWWWHD